MRLWSWGPPNRAAGGMRFSSMGVYTAPYLPAPQTGLEMERRALPCFQMGCLTTPAALTPPASREENLPHYPASLTQPRGSTELKEIFYDPTLRYVLLKAEHRPPLPHSSDQRLWYFSLCPFFRTPELFLSFLKHPAAWLGQSRVSWQRKICNGVKNGAVWFI